MAKKNAFNTQHQSRGGEQQASGGDKPVVTTPSFIKKEIKVEEKPIIVDDIKSKYTVSNKPIRVYVYFYEEGEELKYTLDKAVVSGKKFEEEWFEFNRDTWLIREIINSNSMAITNSGATINPMVFSLAKFIFLLRGSSIKMDLKFEKTSDGIMYIANMSNLFGLNGNNSSALNDKIIMAINESINTFYRN